MRSPALVLLAVAGLLACMDLGGSARQSGGPDPELEREARIAAGKELFAAFCASCHGAGARGDGPVAAALVTPPADLTHIAARHGGRFEGGDVAAFIDGRTSIAAHGDREMPVWGRIYDDRNESIMTDETRLSPGMIFNVVEYLRSIQAR